MNKSFKCHAFRVAKALGLFTLSRRITARGVRILCYHGVWLGDDGFAGDAMFMRKETFEQRLELIERLGYPVVSLETAIEAFEGKAELPVAAVVITIDDGWYCTYAAMVPALRRHGMSATLYCDSEHLTSGKPVAHVMSSYLRQRGSPGVGDAALEAELSSSADRSAPLGDRIAAASMVAAHVGVDIERYLACRVFEYMSPAQLKELAEAGLDVQLHTHRHSIHDHSVASIEREINDNREVLSQVLGLPKQVFSHFCYPSGVTSAAAARALGALGLRSSTTTERGLAWAGTYRQLLPRLLDGESTTPIELEADLSGFTEIARRPLRTIAMALGWVSPKPDQQH
jgi:peptidoglycan/xylan/chitin deacetylase (PgdA/CDA1 family)